jgi:hypothetical protein
MDLPDAIPVQQEALLCNELTHPRDGTPSPADLAPKVVPRQVTKWGSLTGSGIPLETLTPTQCSPPTRTLADTPDSHEEGFTAALVEASTAVSAAGVAVGAIPPSDSAGDAGGADGDSVSAGATVGLPIGRSILILTGIASGGLIRISIPRRLTSIPIRTSAEDFREGRFQLKRVASEPHHLLFSSMHHWMACCNNSRALRSESFSLMCA